jgi:hypothetical protein
LSNFVRLQHTHVIRRDHPGVGAIASVTRRKPVQSLAHPARQRFFAALVA